MSSHDEKRVLLALKNVDVKFNVRGRTLSAIRNVSLDVYEDESLAIVGESGSGKSVLTKTFAGMLDSNGYISNGSIILSDDEISETNVKLTPRNRKILARLKDMLDRYSVLERGAAEYVACAQKKEEIRSACSLSPQEENEYAAKAKALQDKITELINRIGCLDGRNAQEAAQIREAREKVGALQAQQKQLSAEKSSLAARRKSEYERDAQRTASDKRQLEELSALREKKIAAPDKEGTPYGLREEVLERNERIAYEILLSIGRYPFRSQLRFILKLRRAFRLAMSTGEDLTRPETLNKIFETVAFRVEFRSLDEAAGLLRGYAILDCAKVKYTNDWQQIRGCRIATVFQDPMTSLNPVLTIGKQIMTVILKHQKCSKQEARERTIDIMRKVGISDAEKRFNDYPFQYSGGMRQRIVIAIALSCQPKILICDEPTTALDVTIQAQILDLIKALQKDFHYTIVFITHDLGVVANIADRVAVLYAGQIVEIGTVEEIFYDPRHPYTWALLSSLPQLAERNTELYSITGTPPSLYNVIVGDPFAPRNPYCLKIDMVKEPPMFRISDTHYAKTWLLDPRSPQIEKPEGIRNIHEKLLKSLHI